MHDHTPDPSRRTAIFAGAAAMAAGAALLDTPSARAAVAAAASTTLPVNRINAAMGCKGTVEDDGVLHFDMDRSDFNTTAIMGVGVDPGLGFDTEISFQAISNGAIVKYEICLLDSEVNPVLQALIAARLTPLESTLTAIHNHFLGATPEVKFLHGTAVGDPVVIARALHDAMQSGSKQPFETSPPGNTGLPNARIAAILGGSKSISGKVLNVTVDRADTTVELGQTLKPSSQQQSMFAFQDLGGGQAAVDGEFVMIAKEVDKVTNSLVMNNFEVMAVHNHELFEEPDRYYLHCFQTGDPLQLAKWLRMALNRTNSKFTSGGS